MKGVKCELSAKNICFKHHRVFNAEVAEAQRTQRKTLKTLRPLRLRAFALDFHYSNPASIYTLKKRVVRPWQVRLRNSVCATEWGNKNTVSVTQRSQRHRGAEFL